MTPPRREMSARSLLRPFKALYRTLVRDELHYLDLKHRDASARVDILNLAHSYEILRPARAERIKRVKTAVIDATLSEQALFERCNRTTRYEIDRARREGVVHVAAENPTNAEIDEFLAVALAMRGNRNVQVFDRSFYRRCRDRGEFVVTTARSARGKAACYHAYVRRDKTALLLNSFTLGTGKHDPSARSFAGRANRLCHWEDVLFFKSRRLRRVDLGGVPVPDLAAFKAGLGAETVDAYYQVIPLSAVGRLVVALRDIRP